MLKKYLENYTRIVRVRHAGRLLLGVASAMSMLACYEEQPTSTQLPSSAADAPRRAVSIQPHSIRPEEQLYADLARDAGSTAGFYLDASGTLVVLVRDDADNARARTAMQSMLSRGLLPPSLTRRGPAISIQKAKYSFGELATWRDSIGSQLSGIDGVTSLDLDEVQNRVTVGIDPATQTAARSAVLQLAQSLAIDTSAIGFRVHGYLKYGSTAAAMYSSSIFVHTDTLIGGIIVRTSSASGNNGNPGDCTIGFVADRNGVRAFITATHCTNVWGGGPDGTVMSQWPVRQVGTETIDPNKSQCGVWDWCRNSDAALFNVNAGVPSHRGLIARTTFRNNGYHNGGNGSRTVDTNKPYFFVTWTSGAVVGQVVEKMGMVTGWTWGTISATCVDHFFSQGFPVDYVTKCSLEANINHNSGDSGGPLFSWDGSDQVTLIGTLVGQTTTQNGIFSPYSRIIADMGGTIVATAPNTLSAPTMSGSLSGGTATISWTAVSGATRYNVFRSYYEIVGYDPEWGTPIYENRVVYVATATGTSYNYPGGYSSYGGVGGSAYQYGDTFWVLAVSNTQIAPNSQTVLFYY